MTPRETPCLDLEQIANELEADRSAIFAVLRRHAIGDDGFAEIAAITHQRIAALKAQVSQETVQPGEDVVERVARVLAPHMEGGREFDQMPHDRMALRKWAREGMCNTNDATQDDALEAAQAAIAAIAAIASPEALMQESRDEAG